MYGARRSTTGPILALAMSVVVAACVATAPTPPSDRQAGPQLTAEDRSLVEATRRRALESKLSGKAATWSNRASGNAGRVKPLRTYRTTSGYYCRVYRASVSGAGGSNVRTVTACRDDSGVWQDLPES